MNTAGTRGGAHRERVAALLSRSLPPDDAPIWPYAMFSTLFRRSCLWPLAEELIGEEAHHGGKDSQRQEIHRKHARTHSFQKAASHDIRVIHGRNEMRLHLRTLR